MKSMSTASWRRSRRSRAVCALLEAARSGVYRAAIINLTSLRPPAAVKPTVSKARSPILARYSRVAGLAKKAQLHLLDQGRGQA
jgi:hypothetical protein